MYQTVEIERKDLGIGCTVKRNEYLKKKTWFTSATREVRLGS